MNNQSPRWQLAARSAVAAAVASLFTLSAQALSLGPMVVQSALGEPLRAEIDILEMSAEESSSLRASIASPEAFRAAGLEYNSALTNTRVSLQRRSNGRSFIRLSSDRSITEPFVDLILEASWSNGRIVRDYTMLLDPPSLRAAAPAAIALPATDSSSPVAGASTGTAASQLAPIPPAPRDRSPGTRDKAPTSASKPLRAAVDAAAKLAPIDATGGKQLTVRAGDTATRIALANKPKDISLDQMLVALLRSNPNAFINDNVNRLKKGAVIDLPSAEQAASVPAKEASQLVVASSNNFGEFRRRMAAVAPATSMASAGRTSGGSVQTRIEDKKPAAVAPDKLTLAQGSVQSNSQAAKAAQAAASKEAVARAAEINRNVADLSKLAAASAAPAASSSAPAAVIPASTTPAPVSSAPAASLPAPVASAPKPAASKPAVVKAPPPEPTVIEQLTENPLLPAVGAGLVALLAGFGIYRMRQRKQADSADSSFLDSRLQPDSFFGTSGGQKVDTTDSANGSSSIVYSASQLDGADDVDPVAEADVYLAYGRDLQAEEILKEALKTNSGRLAVHQKLLEIYGKRRDTRNFELTASEAFKLTAGEGQDWIRIAEQGQGLDPGNQLYLPGGQPAVAVGIPSQPMPLDMKADLQSAPAGVLAAGTALGASVAGLATVSLGNRADPDATTSSLNAQPAGGGGVDLDFDLDFSLDDDNAQVITEMGTPESTSKITPVAGAEPVLDMNFDLPPEATQALVADNHTKPGVIEFDLPSLGELSKSGEVSGPVPLEMPGATVPFVEEAEEFKKEAALSFGATQSGALGLAAKLSEKSGVDQLAAMETAPGALEFDIGNLSLDIGNSVLPADVNGGAASLGEAADPLATKLALADEFNSIGDTDGARALIEEVIAEASGDLKAQAQKALAALA